MPFDKTQVKPEVAALLKVRDYIAAHGFCCDVGKSGGERCFYFAVRDMLGMSVVASYCIDLIRSTLIAKYGEPSDQQVFATHYLWAHVGTTERALEIIDAAIARVS